MVFNYTLMRLDNIVAKMRISHGVIEDAKIIVPAMCPVGVFDASTMNKWFSSRRIPASREHLKELEIKFEGGMSEILLKSYALSLSDSFWVKPQNDHSSWRDVNHFTNNFSDDIGAFLMREISEIATFSTPSNTTDGVFPKKWVIRNGIRYLMKTDAADSIAPQFLNEVFAHKVAKFLELDSVPYFKAEDSACMCPCFIKPGQNLVSAYNYICNLQGKTFDSANHPEIYAPLCDAFGKRWLDGMLLLDYIIMNKDRHLKNFGLVQDALTGEYIKPAPIFDCGSSMFSCIRWGDDAPFDNVADSARPFFGTHSQQIQLIDTAPFGDALRELEREIQGMVCDFYGGAALRRTIVNGLSADENMGILLRRRIRALMKGISVKPSQISIADI